jgi:hypothetical protein
MVLAGSFAALVLSTSLAAAEFQVSLTVREPAGVQRRAEPVSGGVPLPRGKFAADQPLRVTTADGRPVPCQVLPLVVEKDGTARWVLVDFQGNFEPDAAVTYVLRPGRATEPERPLRVTDDAAGIAVDTGAVRFTISRDKPFGAFSTVRAGDREVVTGGRATYTALQGRSGWDDAAMWQPREFVAGPPETLRTWHAGPMRVTVEASGRFIGDPCGMRYRAWITAWAGSSRVYVKYSLVNANPDRRTAVPVTRSAITLQVPDAKGARIGAAETLQAAGAGWLHAGLDAARSPKDAPAFRAGDGPKELWAGALPDRTAGGWVATGGVLACDVLFASNPARRLEAGDGRIVLEGVAPRFDAVADRDGRHRAQPYEARAFWLYDCSHHSSEYLLDLAAPQDAAACDALAGAARNRLWIQAPPAYYADVEAVAQGSFGTLDDEMATYRTWGWTWDEKREPRAPAPGGGQFVAWEDNHYESEADSVQGLLLMYLRTGERGWFDQAEGWARYHMDLESWRTDGWRWKDGAVWFPQGGPQGNMRVRQDWNFTWGPDWAERKGNADCIDLWRHSQAKACYCHFYGSGLVDYYLLTGERDALEAALDNVETKDEEFRRSKKYEPGKTPIGETRGFGRGFEVMMRVLEADPSNAFVEDLCRLAARTLWQSPLLDERGFHCRGEGAEAAGLPAKELSPKVRAWMAERGITFTVQGDKVDALSKNGLTWKVRSFGGTWEHAYVHSAADMYARHFDDEDLRDFVVGFAQMTRKYLQSPKCHQTWYKTHFDVPDLGVIFDPWVIEHADTTDGHGCVHSGYYTRFFPDACARGYAFTGERALLEKAKEFWDWGSKRRYQTKDVFAGPDEVGMFAGHVPPKDDEVLSTARLFREWSHPRSDAQPPAAVRDLAVRLLGDGEAEVRFTAPADAGGGRVVRYQVKAAPLPLAAYDNWDYARDLGRRRNWWMAANCRDEPAPAAPGTSERFIVRGVPSGETLYFAVRAYDDSWNRSAMSNVAKP